MNISPFKFWCQKVLPAVYDDSLSYYELLCKVVDKLNEVITSQNLLSDDFATLTQAFNTLKNYVDNYFINLDVQDEVNKKVDELATTGYFDTLVNVTQFNELKQELNTELADFENTTNSNFDDVNKKISLLNNAPKGSFPTLAALTAAFPGGDNGYYIVGENWYYWNGSAWTLGGVFTQSEIPNNSITPVKINGEIQTSFVSENYLQTGYIDISGSFVTQSSSNFYKIPVTPNQLLIVAGAHLVNSGGWLGTFGTNGAYLTGYQYPTLSKGEPNPIITLGSTRYKSFNGSTTIYRYIFKVPQGVAYIGLNAKVGSSYNDIGKIFSSVFSIDSYMSSVSFYSNIFPQELNKCYVTEFYNQWNNAILLDGAIMAYPDSPSNTSLVVSAYSLPYRVISVKLRANTKYYISRPAFNETLEGACLSLTATGTLTYFPWASLTNEINVNSEGNILLTKSYTPTIDTVLFIPCASNTFNYSLPQKTVISTQINNNAYDSILKINYLPLFVQTETVKPLKGYNITYIGDSITEFNNTASVNYVRLLSNYFESGFTNLGIGGTGFAAGFPTNQNYATRINQIPNNTNIICVSASFNDVGKLPLGNLEDTTTTTITGYMNLFFTSLINAFPSTPILVYTLNPWATGQSVASVDYANRVAEIAYKYHLPFLSCFAGCGLYPWITGNNTFYFNNADGVHPNNEGHKLLFSMLKDFINSHYR